MFDDILLNSIASIDPVGNCILKLFQIHEHLNNNYTYGLKEADFIYCCDVYDRNTFYKRKECK